MRVHFSSTAALDRDTIAKDFEPIAQRFSMEAHIHDLRIRPALSKIGTPERLCCCRPVAMDPPSPNHADFQPWPTNRICSSNQPKSRKSVIEMAERSTS
jgi:hypothetical protein